MINKFSLYNIIITVISIICFLSSTHKKYFYPQQISIDIQIKFGVLRGSSYYELKAKGNNIGREDKIVIQLTNKLFKISSVAIAATPRNQTKFSELNKHWKVFQNSGSTSQYRIIIPISRIGSDFYKISIKITRILNESGQPVKDIPSDKTFDFFVTYQR